MRCLRFLCLPLLALLAASAAFAAPTLVIRGGRLFDGTGAPARPVGAIVVEGDRVSAILPAGAKVPEGARVIDASGCTILPGLFDLHIHSAVPGAGYSVGLVTTPAENLTSHLDCGVTNVLDLHADEATIFALRDSSRASATMARLYTVGAAFTVPRGHGTQFGIPANEVTSTREVDARFAALLPKKPDAIKAILEHGKWGGLSPLPTLSESLFRSVADHARAARLPLFVHVWTLDEAKTAVRGGARALAHGVFIGKVASSLTAEMKARHVAYVPTLTVVLASLRAMAGSRPYASPLAREALHPDLYAALNDSAALGSLSSSPMARMGADEEGVALANLKAMSDAGVEIGIGTDAGNPQVPHGPGLLYELGLYVDAGLTPAQALHAATQTSARILGVEDRFGTIARGKVADLMIVRGDPSVSIADIWNVTGVVKGGVVVDRAALAARNVALARPAVVRAVGADLPVELAGFDDGALACAWGGTWKPWSDQVATGKSSATLESMSEDGARALRLKGVVAEGFPYGAWAGATVAFDPRGKLLADGSHYTGLKLRVRGTPRRYSFTVQCAAVKDYNVFSAALPVGEAWSEVEIPFASLKQIGFGKPVAWTAKDITGLTIDARNGMSTPGTYGEFHLDIDWIRAY